MILEQINNDIKDAMKAKDDLKRDALRFLKSNIQKQAKDTQKDADDDMCITVAKRLVKQNIEAIKLVNDPTKLYGENDHWNTYIPKLLSEEDTRQAVELVIKGYQGADIKSMGKIMGTIKQQLGQSVDMSLASKITKELLS